MASVVFGLVKDVAWYMLAINYANLSTVNVNNLETLAGLFHNESV